MLVPLSYNLRSLFVRKSATLLTILGIGATVAIVSGIIALQQGFSTMFTAGGRDDVAVFLRPGATNEGDSQFSRDRGLELIKTVPYVPLSHPFVERLIGTVRRELLDHVPFWNVRDLERKLAAFKTYYNSARTHRSLDGQAPIEAPKQRHGLGPMRWQPHCRSLYQLPIPA